MDDDDDIALADSFINFEAAACSPTSDNPPEPLITESGSSDPDPQVGSSSVEERIVSSGLVDKEVTENESSGVRGEIIAIDDDAVGVEIEGGEVRGMTVSVDGDAVGVEIEGGEVRGKTVAVDDDAVRLEIECGEVRGEFVAVDDDAVRLEIEGGEVRGFVAVDDNVEMESEDGEIRGNVIAYDDEIRGDVIASDDEIRGDVNDDEIRGDVNDDEIRGEIVAVDDNVEMESEDGEIRGNVIAYDDEIRGDVIASDDEIRGDVNDDEIRGDVNDDEIRGEIVAVDDNVEMESEDGEIRGNVIAYDDEIRGDVIASDDEIRGDVNDDEIRGDVNDDEIRGEIVAVDKAVGMESEGGEIRGDFIANDDEIRREIVANDDLNVTVTEGFNKENECPSAGIKIQEEYELEEGEIVESDNDRKYGLDDEESSDNDIGDDRKDGLKNELEILPRVPPVNVKLGPHHIMLPLGVVTSIVGGRVVVEGSENHDPLDQGSVLWITGRQTPLGVIDDTFAQVKNPHYGVRYNSEDEIPEGVHEGTLISVVAEFAKHVLKSKDLYKKGSDASGMNDEEVSHETEFSDDEQEAEYMRIQGQAKRGQSSQNSGSLKNDWQHVPLNDGSMPKRLMVAHGYGPPIPSSGQGFSGVGRGHSSPLPPQQALPPWYQENSQISHQQPMQGIPSQQQFNPSYRFPTPTVYHGRQPNMYAEPIHAQGLLNQNQWTNFSQFQAPTYFQPVNVSGILGASPHQFNPTTYFPSPPIPGNQGGPPQQFCPPANFRSPPILGYQSGPPHQFNPPTNFRSPPISANQHPPQFPYQFNSGASDGRERSFAARRRPSYRGGKGWRPAR